MSKKPYCGLILLLSVTQACASDAPGEPVDASTRDAAVTDGAAISSTETHDAGRDGGEPAFVATGVIAGLPWGPSFVGIEDDVANPGDGDVALGVFWDPTKIAIAYADDTCIAVHTRKGEVVGRDVGALTVSGGSGMSPQPLTRNAQGYYYLDGGGNPWRAGDALRLVNSEHSAGPVTLPGAFASTNLAQLTTATRAHALTLQARGSNGALIGASLAGSNDQDSYLLICMADASTGKLVISPGALAVFPDDVTMLHLKLQAANAADGVGFRLMGAGASVSTDLTLTP